MQRTLGGVECLHPTPSLPNSVEACTLTLRPYVAAGTKDPSWPSSKLILSFSLLALIRNWKIYIETTLNVLIEVSPQIRIPRTFKRFSGLMGERQKEALSRVANVVAILIISVVVVWS